MSGRLGPWRSHGSGEERGSAWWSRIKELFDIPEGYKAVSIIPIGHLQRPHRPRPRLPIHELVFNEKFGAAYYNKPEEVKQ